MSVSRTEICEYKLANGYLFIFGSCTSISISIFFHCICCPSVLVLLIIIFFYFTFQLKICHFEYSRLALNRQETSLINLVARQRIDWVIAWPLCTAVTMIIQRCAGIRCRSCIKHPQMINSPLCQPNILMRHKLSAVCICTQFCIYLPSSLSHLT